MSAVKSMAVADGGLLLEAAPVLPLNVPAPEPAEHHGPLFPRLERRAPRRQTLGEALAAQPRFRAAWWAPVFLVALDILAVQLALLFGAAAAGLVAPWLPFHAAAGPPAGLGPGGLLLAAAYLGAGLRPGYGLSPVERLRRQTLATLAVFSLLAVWDCLVQRNLDSCAVLVLAMLAALVLVPAVEALGRLLLHRVSRWGMPVVLLGEDEPNRALAVRLANNWQLGLVPVAAILDLPPERRRRRDDPPAALDSPELQRLARTVGTVMVSRLAPGDRRQAELLSALPYPRIVVVPEMLGLDGLCVTGRDIGGVLGLQINKGLLLRRNRVVKRCIDLLAAAFGMAVYLPLLALAALAVQLVDPGPVFYAQKRRGQDGRAIRVWKLRTMYRDAEARLERHLAADEAARREWMRFYKLKADPRILPWVGRFLRRTSVDELPQLWNVLKGEMSLIGPRPLPDYHLAAFDEGFRTLRQTVLPGCTGLWQISGRSDGDIELLQAYDGYYVRNWSIWLDLHVLLATLAVVATGKGAR